MLTKIAITEYNGFSLVDFELWFLLNTALKHDKKHNRNSQCDSTILDYVNVIRHYKVSDKI